ncbi:outer membrane protein [Pelagibacterium halotolerans]|uniref:outer membrane protein n=1 Tax=Pelagibacterium halotolerans TaxID=531813 RepID=UPI00384FA6E7
MKRNLIALVMLGGAVFIAAPAIAADPVVFDDPVYKDYIPPYVPEVDDGLEGAFYLRGSVSGDAGLAHIVNHPNFSPQTQYGVEDWGFGYSAGIGAGYETGTGLRFDVTVDYLSNEGMSITVPPGTTGANGDPDPGKYTLNLRSTIALANAYYDFGLGNQGLSAAGGAFGYVGAGAGVAFNSNTANWPGGEIGARDDNTSFAAALMTGIGYDFGDIVADLGYRALYINRIENNATPNPYSIDDTLIHEIRASLRYRFN